MWEECFGNCEGPVLGTNFLYSRNKTVASEFQSMLNGLNTVDYAVGVGLRNNSILVESVTLSLNKVAKSLDSESRLVLNTGSVMC